ncbi:1,6-anhydro-N-acetylmuramyl-L-alanine amidase AmpD [Proteobacteria bacterium 005FR1]|nr:1,6-anhydro-N-acetylmuramyl-L-alanine amidase AmpD [Proteobacteria bacterium 005FR1]
MTFSIHGGWLRPAIHAPSPNFDSRPPGEAIDLLVIHNISLPPGEFGTGCIQQLFCNTLDCSRHPYFARLVDLKVSSHLLIERGGEVSQFVSFADRAWHAGQSSYGGRSRCNDFSIGIELEGVDDQPYTDTQYAVLAEVTQTLLTHYRHMSKERITGHSDIAPGRKTDPGPAFDWPRFLSRLT